MAPSATVLTAGTVGDFARSCLRGASRPDGTCTAPLALEGGVLARELGGGNINFAFVVEDGRGGAVFVKQAADFIKVLGPEAKLASDRLMLEVGAFRDFAKALGSEGARRFLPELYAMDEVRMAVVMEYFGPPYRVLHDSLCDGEADARVAEALGEVMGLLHSRTHCSVLPAAERERLSVAYHNWRMREIQLEYVFTKFIWADPRSVHLREDPVFLAEVDDLKAAYRSEDPSDLALLHGDLHAGSVLADSATGAVKLIDAELAIYGPPGMDLGELLSSYALAYCLRLVAADGAGCNDILEAIDRCWASYTAVMEMAGLPPGVAARAGELALGFAGCEVARTALGLAYERSFRLQDPNAKAEAEALALTVGERLVRGRRTCGRRGGPAALLKAELRRARHRHDDVVAAAAEEVAPGCRVALSAWDRGDIGIVPEGFELGPAGLAQ